MIADDTKDYELRRQRFDDESLNPNELALAEELETEQVLIMMKKLKDIKISFIDYYNFFNYKISIPTGGLDMVFNICICASGMFHIFTLRKKSLSEERLFP